MPSVSRRKSSSPCRCGGAGIETEEAVPAPTDPLTHDGRLATATDLPPSLDPALCQTALAMARTVITADHRRLGGLGPAVAVPAAAPACDRLAAFSGGWPEPAAPVVTPEDGWR